ncbi:hypothetical protein A2763_00880 [Candidatus Kaiserbacteria bacterium RIFCSPHIGHO2_01_FULL_54_36]|uniref:Uncharacterized protein n=1 Tax=Candidatus Kaiserbacteria bacterium RIFCSPHIGHO2_01_FULL_54_36 TaxID=1798482 RepID=A0A1F6CNY4_9BACT|nr:MAG: hypothetical protein A2763_00880 [Candidatus Kaiserbacteria bacterium RIFCSPHIGHO2_01_FULL_54_36]OGG75579.1 MAG: hypothetical protein A3A41_03085 [Candidatus Kaiserbacteria bacterium RIFCSPLOWO2_01_FULL_54_22]
MRSVHIKVRVQTGVKNEKVHKISDTHFELSVREKPENNLANARVVALIAAQLGVPVSAVRIVKGHHSPSKILSVASQKPE